MIARRTHDDVGVAAQGGRHAERASAAMLHERARQAIACARASRHQVAVGRAARMAVLEELRDRRANGGAPAPAAVERDGDRGATDGAEVAAELAQRLNALAERMQAGRADGSSAPPPA